MWHVHVARITRILFHHIHFHITVIHLQNSPLKLLNFTTNGYNERSTDLMILSSMETIIRK